MTLAILTSALLVLSVLSVFILEIFKAEFIEAAPFLFWYALSVSLFTLASLIVNFHLSLGQTKIVVFPIVASIAQVIGIIFFHQSLSQVITVSIWVSALLLISCFVYFGYVNKIGFRYSSRL
jgi:O-antigen/teichoic acid export membrane protein